MNFNEKSISKYVCINCGAPVEELHKKYSASVIKIMNCNECNEIADKYIEYEPIVILIDMILLSRPAYRHVLYNSPFRIFWKLNVVIILIESYILWKDQHWNTEDLIRMSDEELFYLNSVLSVIDKFVLFILLIFSSKFCDKPTHRTSSYNTLIDTLKSMALASIAKFFLIPILIWKNNTSDVDVAFIHMSLVTGYYIICLMTVYSVLVDSKRSKIFAIIIAIMFTKQIAFIYINNHIKLYFV